MTTDIHLMNWTRRNRLGSILAGAGSGDRLAILSMLAWVRDSGESFLSPAQIADRLGLSAIATLRDLQKLAGADLVERSRSNRCYYAITPDGTALLRAASRLDDLASPG